MIPCHGPSRFQRTFLLEINIARQLVSAADAVLGSDNGGSERAKLSIALAHIAHEHIEVIFHLFENGWFSSGYALMRPAIETTYKCIWITTVADDVKVSGACKGRDVYGDLKTVIKEIETAFDPIGWGGIFAKVRPSLRLLHERTHSGGDQILRRMTADDTRAMRMPEYDGNQLISDIRTLAGMALLATFPTAKPEDIEQLNALLLSNYSYLPHLPS